MFKKYFKLVSLVEEELPLKQGLKHDLYKEIHNEKIS